MIHRTNIRIRLLHLGSIDLWPERHTFRESDPVRGGSNKPVPRTLALTWMAVQEGGVFAAKLTFVRYATEEVIFRQIRADVGYPFSHAGPHLHWSSLTLLFRTLNLEMDLGLPERKPSDYPLSPFKMRFDPPLFHPNSEYCDPPTTGQSNPNDRQTHRALLHTVTQSIPMETCVFLYCIRRVMILQCTNKHPSVGAPFRAWKRSSLA